MENEESSLEGATEVSNSEDTPQVIVKESNNEMNMFKDSQWLLVKVRISDLEVDDHFKNLGFKISGGHLFFDLNSREVILSEDYEEQTNIISYREEDSFTGSLGTKLFNLPLRGFRSVKKFLLKPLKSIIKQS